MPQEQEMIEALRCADVSPAHLMTPLIFAPERISVLKLLGRFKKEKRVIEQGVERGPCAAARP